MHFGYSYRDFPVHPLSDISYNTDMDRTYLCNMMATVYRNSSRETLLHVINENKLTEHCYIKPRLL